jgi:competence protein ComEA
VRGPAGASASYGEWLFNVVVASVSALVTALLVVGLSIAVDRIDSQGIEIMEQTSPEFIVQVSGAVATPGVYEIASNGRLADAVDAAGEFTQEADVVHLNLAARIGDGEHITIPAVSSNFDQVKEEHCLSLASST